MVNKTQNITHEEPLSAHPDSFVDCSADKKLTEQHHKDACNINNVINRYKQTGVLENTQQKEPQYGDITQTDFQSSMEIIANANSMFEELPSNIRKRFKNNPGEFLEFVHNPDNEAEMVELGIANQRPPEPTEPAPNGSAGESKGVAAVGGEAPQEATQASTTTKTP